MVRGSVDSRIMSLDDYCSRDAPMQSCLDRARLAARTDLPVLLLGESGTGKTILARAIHNSSRRATGPFVAFNGAALSDTLLDSQLFGHERGAFTGAQKMVKGKFELADGGTLFIDEIADLSLPAQAKILRAIEYGEFERLGGETLLVADVRPISATHLPLQAYMTSDRFRCDLFQRIAGITVTLPPLRDRREDLRTLVAAEIAVAGQRKGKHIVGLSKAAADALFAYHWPGNLRELQRVLDVAVAVTDGDVIEAEAIVLGGTGAPDGDVTAVRAAADASTDASGAPMAATAVARSSADADLSLRAAEWSHIRHVLEIAHGSKRHAARLLRLSRSTLDRKLAEMVRAAPSRKEPGRP